MNVKPKKTLFYSAIAIISILFVVIFVSVVPFYIPPEPIPDPPSGNEITISGKPILDQPTLTDIDGNIDLHWSGVSGALAYQVYMMEEGGIYLQIRLTLLTSYTKHGLTDGTYSFKVRGYDEEGYTSMSDFRVVVVAIPEPPPPEPPDPPELQSISPAIDIDGSIDLQWSSVSDATIYKVYKSKDGGSWVLVANTGATSIVHQILINGNYKFGVKASNAVGDSEFSNFESVEVNIPDPEDVPNAPDLLLMTDSPNTDGEIRLEWNSVAGATMYTIYRWKDGLNEKILKQDFSENYYDDLVSSDGVYSYKVKAGNSDKEYSEYSNDVSITVQIPAVPDVPVMNELEYEIVNYTVKVYIDWEAVDCDSYVLYRSFDSEVYKPVEGGVYSATGYSEILTEAGTYVYKVSAVNTHGESEMSNSVTIEITEDGGVVDYTILYILLGVLGVLAVPIVIILVKRRNKS